MDSRLAYLDASGLVKLVKHEDETPALRLFLEGVNSITSKVGVVELTRVVRRSERSNDLEADLAIVKHRVASIAISSAICQAAEYVDPAPLRTLDAFHLVTALSIRPSVEVFIAYDRQLLKAAAAAGLRVEAPGAPQLLP